LKLGGTAVARKLFMTVIPRAVIPSLEKPPKVTDAASHPAA
jgi:hypothetical protein